MIDIEKKAQELRKEIGAKKKSETEDETKARMKSVLSERDEALNKIYQYQEKTGVPSKDETLRNFFDIEIRQKDEER